jgi:hypothetical protein
MAVSYILKYFQMILKIIILFAHTQDDLKFTMHYYIILHRRLRIPIQLSTFLSLIASHASTRVEVFDGFRCRVHERGPYSTSKGRTISCIYWGVHVRSLLPSKMERNRSIGSRSCEYVFPQLLISGFRWCRKSFESHWQNFHERCSSTAFDDTALVFYHTPMFFSLVIRSFRQEDFLSRRDLPEERRFPISDEQ